VAELTKIEHLKKAPKRLVKLATVAALIESLLEDMNTEKISLSTDFQLGDLGRRTGVFHASTIGNSTGKSRCGKYSIGCARQLYYDITEAESEGAWDPRIRRILDTGTAVHAQLQAYLAKVAERSDGAYQFTPEVDINPNTNEIADQMDISGHTDGDNLVVEGKDKVRFLLEIKTINDAGYQKTRGPHPEHTIQGTIYQKCLNVPIIVFLYYNKNDSSIAEFVQVYDERRWEAIVDKLDYVRECAMNEEPPEQEHGWHCNNCKYKKICKPPRRSRAAQAKAESSFRSRRRG
jgi:hypothetical protein